MTPAEWVALVGQQGMPVCAAGVVLWVVVWSLRRAAITQDQLLDRILHGDSNGGPSLQRIGDQLESVGRQQGVNTTAIEQLATEVSGMREDVQGAVASLDVCRATPGSPLHEPGSEGQ